MGIDAMLSAKPIKSIIKCKICANAHLPHTGTTNNVYIARVGKSGNHNNYYATVIQI